MTLRLTVSPAKRAKSLALRERTIDARRGDLERVGRENGSSASMSLRDPLVRRRDRVEIEALFAVQQDAEDRRAATARLFDGDELEAVGGSLRFEQPSVSCSSSSVCRHILSPPCPQNKRSERKPTSRKNGMFHVQGDSTTPVEADKARRPLHVLVAR